LPLVTARYTEVELQLVLLERDLERGDVDVVVWDARLAALLEGVHDGRERGLVEGARRRLRGGL
jgi:hypothetical protein